VDDKDSGNPRVTAEVRELLLTSYKEVLDAVKHQDDKIGRLFAGIAFLTAASLAMANLGSAKYLAQKYVDWPDAPPAMLSLAVYLVLVLMSVTILIGSLATPLRVPGLSRRPRRSTVDWVGPRASQIYFGEISHLGILEWEKKWTGDVKNLETELAQSLVGETHNLAVRTQFKYGRMNEAIALFNLALLYLAITMIFCVTSATGTQTSDEATVPVAARWALAASVAVFFYIQLLSQVRYTRQTMDELAGNENRLGGALRYVWVYGVALWVLLVGSGRFVDGWRAFLVWMVAAVAAVSLIVGTWMHARQGRAMRKQQAARRSSDDRREFEPWLGPILALGTGSVLTFLSMHSDAHGDGPAYSLSLVLIGAALLTLLAVLSPTLNLRRNVRSYRRRAASS
jgi:hypothetical protein